MPTTGNTATRAATTVPAYTWTLIDGELRYVDCNAAARALDPETLQFVGALSAADLADQNPDFVRRLRRTLEEKTVTMVEAPFRRHSDGLERWLGFTFVYAPPASVIVLSEDITARRARDHDLRQSNARFRAAFERSPLAKALIPLDADGPGPVMVVNDACCDLFGYAREQLVGKLRPGDLAHPDDRDVGRAELRALADRDTDLCHFEKRYLAAGGRVLTLAVWTSLVSGPDEPTPYALCHLQDVTERRRGEDALRESEERYRRIIETTSEGVWVVDGEARTTYVNARMAEMLGYQVDEMLGTTLDRYQWDGRRPPLEEKAANRARGDLAPDETRLRRRDGTLLWVGISHDTLTGPDGEYAGTLAMMNDITQRKQAETELHDAKVRFEGAFQHAPIGMALVDVRDGHLGRLLLPNPALARLLGRSEEQLTGKVLAEVTHPDDVERNLGLARRLTAGEIRAYETDKRFVRPDGEVVLALMSVSLVRDSNGASLYAVAHIRDITASRRAEQEIEEREQRFRAAFASGLDAMLIADDDRAYISANDAAGELLGVDPASLPGHRLDEYATMDPALIDGMWQQMREAGSLAGEHEVRRADGEVREVEFAARAGFMPGRHLLVMRDITARKRSEREAERMESALHQAQKLETVGQLAGGVAHDFNNVLAVILTSSEFALGELGDHPAAEDVRAIRAAAERAAALTHQLLVFSRREIAQPELLDLNEVVRTVEHLLRRAIGEYIRLEVELGADLPGVTADPSHIEQVLLNLAVNARDAMPDGGTLRVRTAVTDLDHGYARLNPSVMPGRYVTLAVSDTGSGMVPDVISRAFEPFFTTKPKGTGTGLGLATAYGIAKQNGGHLALYSEVGEGTVARLYLPPAEGEVTGAVTEEPAPARSSRGERILVVEDEDGVRAATARILTSHGYDVLCAGDPHEALRLAADNDVDVVVSDVVMPGMPGPQMVAELRERLPELSVIFMSGYTDRPGALPADAGFLSKPFSGHALLELVGQALDAPDHTR